MSSATGPWIVSARYDLSWFFGGAVASLALWALYLAGLPVLALWWAWLLAFDGPHIAATFSRTYFDWEEWRRRKHVLLGALAAFLVGPLCLALNLFLDSPQPFLVFLGVAAFYGYFHVVRQHYGFLALYKALDRDFDRKSVALDKWLLYIGCWTPYFYFLLSHPKARGLLHLPEMLPSNGLEHLLLIGLSVLWALALVVYVTRHVAGGNRGLGHPKVAYPALTIALYAFIYFVVARAEPVYGASTGPDQDFLLISALITIFHNIQYLGLVWFHNDNRYHADGDFGPARFLNRSPSVFLAGCALFSLVVYLFAACSTAVFPGCALGLGSRVGPFTVGQIGLSLWWGIAIHHYYLDQKIWRVRGDAVLQKSLNLA